MDPMESQEDVEVGLRMGDTHLLFTAENEDRTGWYGILYFPAGDPDDPDRFDLVEINEFDTAEDARWWCDLRDKAHLVAFTREIEMFLAG